jgi:hypothetical protein
LVSRKGLLVAGVLKFLGSGLQSKPDFKNSEEFSGGNFVKTFFFGSPGVLDFSGGDLVDLVKIGDSVTEDFSNEDTLDDGVTSSLDDNGVFIVFQEEVDGIHDVLANTVRFLADSDFVLGASSSFFSGSRNSVVFFKS